MIIARLKVRLKLALPRDNLTFISLAEHQMVMVELNNQIDKLKVTIRNAPVTDHVVF